MRVQINTRQDHLASNLSLLYWSRIILYGIGILALGYCGYTLADAWIFQVRQSQQFEQALKQQTLSAPSIKTPHPQPLPEVSPPEAASPSGVRIEAPRGSGDVLGRIAIERIGLVAMIIEGTDNLALRRAVGHVPETALPGQPGNVAIAGHRDTFFRDLRKIAKYDEIEITITNGSFHYVVDFSEVVEPSAMEVLYPFSDAILTLVTCYPFSYVGSAPKRLIVRAHMLPE